MKNVVNFALEYRENGEKKFKHLEIDFVPHGCHKEFNHFLSISDSVKEKYERMSDIISLLTAEKNKDKIRELKQEHDECADFILQFNNTDILEYRFNILKKVFENNGYKEDAELNNYDWWNDKVDPAEMNRLVTACIFKDIPKKKQ